MSSKNRLKELRDEIDPINLQILEMLNKRAKIALEIGKVHQATGTRIYDPQREAEMLTALQYANEGPFSNETISKLFNEIFRATLNLEEQDARQTILVQRKRPDQHTIIEFSNGLQPGQRYLSRSSRDPARSRATSRWTRRLPSWRGAA